MLRIAIYGTAVVGLAAAALAQQSARKPPVPPGVDPGGAAIAFISDGVDYVRPAIARRLARDGEGEIVGWDFVDNDRRPYAPCGSPSSDSRPDCIPFPEVLGAAGKVDHRLIALRAQVGSPQSLVDAVRTADQMQARTVVIALPQPAPIQFVTEAARRFPRIYFVAVTDIVSLGSAGDVAGRNYDLVTAAAGESRGETAADEIRCRILQAPDFARLARPESCAAHPVTK